MPKPTCINLLTRFGGVYCITFDPAYDAKNIPRRKLDPWMMELPCRDGLVIYPRGGDLLAIECDGHHGIAKRLAAIEGVKLTQDGDREKTFVFPVSLFEAVAAVAQPKRKRVLTPEHKAKLVESSRPHRFRAVAVLNGEKESQDATNASKASQRPPEQKETQNTSIRTATDVIAVGAVTQEDCAGPAG